METNAEIYSKNCVDLGESCRKDNFWNQRGQESHKKTQRINQPSLTSIQRLNCQPGNLHGIDLGPLHIYFSCVTYSSCWNPILRAGTVSDSVTGFWNSFLLLSACSSCEWKGGFFSYCNLISTGYLIDMRNLPFLKKTENLN